MKKILMIGINNTVFKNVYNNLFENYNIQVCEPINSTIKRMVRIVKPDMIFIINDNYRDIFFRQLKDDANGLPILVLCEENDQLEKKLKEESFNYLYRPINNTQLEAELDKILEPEDFDINDKLNRKTGDSKNKENALRILAIDDNPQILRNIKKILNDDYNIMLATSVEKAAEMIEEKPFDLILLDYEMPEIDGITAFKIFKTHLKTKDKPIVFLTAVSDKRRIMEVVALKPAAYLLKPINPDMIKKTIEDLIGK